MTTFVSVSTHAHLAASSVVIGFPLISLRFQSTVQMSNFTTATSDSSDLDCNVSILDDPLVSIVLAVVYGSVFLASLIGNSFAIIVICSHRSMRTSTNFFLGNLAFADLLVAIFCILQNFFHISSSNWALGSVFCKLYVTILHFAPCTSIGILVCVSLEKYIAVLHPLLALKMLTPKLRGAMMAAIWITSLLVNMPYYFTTKELHYKKIAYCARDLGEGQLNIRSMITASFVIWYLIPLITIAFLYTRIGLVLWRSSLKPLQVRYSNGELDSRANYKATGNGLADSAGTATLTISYETEALNDNENNLTNNGTNRAQSSDDSTGQTNENVNSELIESRKKVIRLLIAIVTSFAVLTLPNHIRLLHLSYDDSHNCNSNWTALLQPLSYLALFCSSSVNPILYAFLSKRFRSATRDIMKCRFGGVQRKTTRTRTILSEVQQDAIMSRSPSLTRATFR
ncbi:Trissin receptor [Aphelenchoides besseyi]|nr:Trissin receptor [Aphelenchoides besseyi]